MRISKIWNALFLQREEAHFWESIDNTGVRSKQERAESWNGRWKIYVDPIDSRSAISLAGRLRLQSATLWSTSQRISVSVNSAGLLNLTLKWIIFFRCCDNLMNRPMIGLCLSSPLFSWSSFLHMEEILYKTSCYIVIHFNFSDVQTA